MWGLLEQIPCEYHGATVCTLWKWGNAANQGFLFHPPSHPRNLVSTIKFFRANVLFPNHAVERGTFKSFVKKCYVVNSEILHIEMYSLYQKVTVCMNILNFDTLCCEERYLTLCNSAFPKLYIYRTHFCVISINNSLIFWEYCLRNIKINNIYYLLS